MFGITELIEYPGMQDPELLRMEIFDTVDEAIFRSNELLDEYNEEFGEDYYDRASKDNMFAYAGNGDVNWRLYISEITEKKEE